jgi:3-deoxy-D-manno-octulosonic-acid transferase
VLVQCCAARNVRLGLLNARMSSRAFLSWFQPRVSRGLLRCMLGHFSLIVPQSDIVSVVRSSSSSSSSSSGDVHAC